MDKDAELKALALGYMNRHAETIGVYVMVFEADGGVGCQLETRSEGQGITKREVAAELEVVADQLAETARRLRADTPRGS